MSVSPIISFAKYQEIINSDRASVLFFWSAFTPACGKIEPVFEQLSGQHPSLGFNKVNADMQAEIMMHAGIFSIPTFAAFWRGKKTDEITEPKPEALEEFIKRALH
ncbi:hypothetical protein EVG20_g2487 [Dentipellis fragilis]|uniref:Thioredoxin domain-containing protein n=1 Tax=Dentipellis fragilis TaxID=205917 RepID=A0A4Y9Z9P9_9AGAM|nr:hypothetical protein EVG20_g2487 [Dentipellis fragilis]